LEIDDNAWFAHSALVRSYVLKGIMPEALRCAETAYRLAPWNAIVVGQLAALLVRTGDRNVGEALMRQFMDSPNPRSTSVGMAFLPPHVRRNRGSRQLVREGNRRARPRTRPLSAPSADETIAGQLTMAGAGQNDAPAAEYRMLRSTSINISVV